MITGMDRETGRTIAIGCAVIPAIIIFVFGCAFISFSAGLYATAAWIGAYLAWNIGIIDQQDWQCIERLGQFYDVKLGGFRLYCLRGLVDKIKVRGTLLEQKQPIFLDETAGSGLEVLDFTDGSAPIEGYMWYRVGHADGKDNATKEAVKLFVYMSADPVSRIVQIAEDRLRPRFQSMDIDTASRTRGDVVNGVLDDIEDELDQYGLFFSKKPPIVIADIGLTTSQKELREARLRGKSMADETENESAGYRRGIEAIMYRTKPDGTREEVCDLETAMGIWERQQTRRMLEKTGSNITIFGQSAANVILTVDASPKKGG